MRGVVALGQLLGAPALLAADEVDRAAVHEREDPGAGLRPLRDEPPGRAPDREERLLHGILGERLVAEHAQREPVGDAVVPVVQLGERELLRSGHERHDRFVGQVSQVAGHDPDSTTSAGRFGPGCGPNRNESRFAPRPTNELRSAGRALPASAETATVTPFLA